MGQNFELNIHQDCMEIKLSCYLSSLDVGQVKRLWEHTVSMQNDWSWFPHPIIYIYKKKKRFHPGLWYQGFEILFYIDDKT